MLLIRLQFHTRRSHNLKTIIAICISTYRYNDALGMGNEMREAHIVDTFGCFNYHQTDVRGDKGKQMKLSGANPWNWLCKMNATHSLWNSIPMGPLHSYVNSAKSIACEIKLAFFDMGNESPTSLVTSSAVLYYVIYLGWNFFIPKNVLLYPYDVSYV